MAPDIARSIPEQHELLKNFQDPIEFMLLYISVYEQQLQCSTKVFLHQIPYFAEFQLAFLDRVLELALDGPAGLESLDGLESVLVSFRARPFYDEEFYACCVEILFKGLNISVDRVQAEVLGGCYDGVAILYKYLPANIDLSKQVAKYAADCLENAADDEAASVILASLRLTVDSINERIADVQLSRLLALGRRPGDSSAGSDVPGAGGQGQEDIPGSDVPDQQERDRARTICSSCFVKVGPSPLIVGAERVKRYQVADVLGQVVGLCKAHLRTRAPDIAYNRLMRLSELIADIYKLDDMSNEVKEFAKYLLVESYRE